MPQFARFDRGNLKKFEEKYRIPGTTIQISATTLPFDPVQPGLTTHAAVSVSAGCCFSINR
jgi:hypothetical protein